MSDEWSLQGTFIKNSIFATDLAALKKFKNAQKASQMKLFVVSFVFYSIIL